MKTNPIRLALRILPLVVTVTFWGCYTQLGSVGEEQSDSRYAAAPQQDQQTVNYDQEYYGGAVDYVDGDWDYRPAYSFAYYYPPVWPSEMFALEYDQPPWGGYGSSYGSPWQPAPAYGAFGYPYYYSPYHRTFIPAFQYDRVYGYTGSAAPKDNGQVRASGGTRNFGTERSDFAPSTGGTQVLPTAGGFQRTPISGAPPPAAGTATDNSRAPGNSRGSSATQGNNQSTNSGKGNRGTNSRPDRRRDTAPMPTRPAETPAPAPAAPANDPGRSTPSTAPAPAAPPPQPPPAPDTSSSRRGRGGSRGG